MDFKGKNLSAFGAIILKLYMSCGSSLKDTYVAYVYHIELEKFLKIKWFMFLEFEVVLNVNFLFNSCIFFSSDP